MLDWSKVLPQINALAEYTRQRADVLPISVIAARRVLWTIGLEQQGIPVVGPFCVIHERPAGDDGETRPVTK